MTSELRLNVGMYDLCKPRYIILILGKLTDQQFYSKFLKDAPPLECECCWVLRKLCHQGGNYIYHKLLSKFVFGKPSLDHILNSGNCCWLFLTSMSSMSVFLLRLRKSVEWDQKTCPKHEVFHSNFWK